MSDSNQHPFWESKSLDQMTASQWEQLCDNCGLCCLHKFEDEDTDEILYTMIVCKYYDHDKCRCSDYENRSINVPNCVPLTAKKAKEFRFLPDSCAYHRLAHGKPLPEWHHLISKDPEAVHTSGVSIKDKAIPEDNIHPDEIDQFIIPN